MEDLLARLTADPLSSNAIIGVVALGLLDWILGVIRALRDGTFDIKYLDVWVRVQLLGRIVPIVLVLLFGIVAGGIQVGDVEFNVLTIAGIGAAAAYAASTAASILASINPQQPNPVPVE